MHILLFLFWTSSSGIGYHSYPSVGVSLRSQYIEASVYVSASEKMAQHVRGGGEARVALCLPKLGKLLPEVGYRFAAQRLDEGTHTAQNPFLRLCYGKNSRICGLYDFNDGTKYHLTAVRLDADIHIANRTYLMLAYERDMLRGHPAGEKALFGVQMSVE